MVQLHTQDIKTTEILGWEGVHLFHFMSSSCSQKVRVFLNLKGIAWESHLIDISQGENFTPWYLGINPRGLVPTLVIDGEVHIESNDIMQLLDDRFADNKLIPEGVEVAVGALLRHEDDLHLDLRTITFRYTQPRGKAPKSEQDLKNYKAGGTGTVEGVPDSRKKIEIDFWQAVARDGITDTAIQKSASRFLGALNELDKKLAAHPYLLGEALSVLDIAWCIYVNRLVRCGYPLERLHGNVNAWFRPLRERPEFAKEMIVPPEIQKSVDANHLQQKQDGTSFVEVAGL